MGVYSSRLNAELKANIASVALAVEAMERKMIAAGLLKENELMEEITLMARQKIKNPGGV